MATSRNRRPRQRSDDRLVKFMGLFGIGLGIAELVAGKKIARRAGLGDDKALVAQAYGAREIISGVLCFAMPAVGIWTRVAGDALDVATLVPAFKPNNEYRYGALTALMMVGGAAWLDLIATRQVAR